VSKAEAKRISVARAVSQLHGIALSERCANLGLPIPAGGVLRFRMFDSEMELDARSFELKDLRRGEHAKADDHILLLHFLLHESPLIPSDKLVSFREFPGGGFYLEPFLSRCAKPLVKRFGNDIEAMKASAARFDHEPFEIGDLGLRIHALGHLQVVIVYRLGDDEFPPAAEILFNQPVRDVFCAEDAAVLASRVCFGLF
jgi:hypothetical protein